MRKLSLILVGLGAVIIVGVLLIVPINTDKNSGTTTNQTVATAQNNKKQSNGKSIVIYMTHTGNTEAVAKTIQKQVGADIYHLQTKEKYPTSYQKMLKVARSEQKQNARPQLAGKLPNLKGYHYIFLGYPIWLDKNPMAINTFLSHYPSFKGKIILPFTTSGSSGLGSSLPELKQHAKQASFRSGLAITDDQLSHTKQLVKSWLTKNHF
ncbi:flavodoxin [Lactiplantibacillus paraxiangfangensis]|uniref:flavodoxin n=1 Tax=Lactiplantibacillus paraxiangfangensis TaxID=3076224 RepID=UPI0030C6F74C